MHRRPGTSFVCDVAKLPACPNCHSIADTPGNLVQLHYATSGADMTAVDVGVTCCVCQSVYFCPVVS